MTAAAATTTTTTTMPMTMATTTLSSDGDVDDAKKEGHATETTTTTTTMSNTNTVVPSDDKTPPDAAPRGRVVDRDWLQKLLRKHSNRNSNSNSNIKAYALAPMVDQSDLPFRLLCRRYGTNLCFTPMIHAKLFATAPAYRQKFMLQQFQEQDRPLIAQLCGSDLEYMAYTAQAVAPYCDAIDINCGCPQSIAKRGCYGAFLLEDEPQLLRVIHHLVRVLSSSDNGNSTPLTVKVRLLPAPEGEFHPEEEEDGAEDKDNNSNNWQEGREQRRRRDASVGRSLRLYEKLVDAGVAMLTVHGRTRFHKGVGTGPADWDAIHQVVQRFGHRIPILANGSIANQNDIRHCLAVTGADGVMSSEAILEYPPLFQGMAQQADVDQNHHHEQPPPPPPRIGRLQLAKEYLELATQHPPDVHGQGSGIKCLRVHTHRFLHADLQVHTDLRQDVVTAESVQDLQDACARLEQLRRQDHSVATETLSWYMRHRTISRDCFGVTVNNNSNNGSTIDTTTGDEEKTLLQVRMEHERTVKTVDLADDAADCFAALFGEHDDEW